jgi:hypothetical protein
VPLFGKVSGLYSATCGFDASAALLIRTDFRRLCSLGSLIGVFLRQTLTTEADELCSLGDPYPTLMLYQIQITLPRLGEFGLGVRAC